MTTDYPGRVKEAILSALMTLREERPMRPTYGRSTEPFDTYRLPDFLRECRTAVEQGLEDYPGVSFRITGAPYDDGTTYLTVYYQAPDFEPTTLEVVVA